MRRGRRRKGGAGSKREGGVPASLELHFGSAISGGIQFIFLYFQANTFVSLAFLSLSLLPCLFFFLV